MSVSSYLRNTICIVSSIIKTLQLTKVYVIDFKPFLLKFQLSLFLIFLATPCSYVVVHQLHYCYCINVFGFLKVTYLFKCRWEALLASFYCFWDRTHYLVVKYTQVQKNSQASRIIGLYWAFIFLILVILLFLIFTRLLDSIWIWNFSFLLQSFQST